ncbi:hypothetical protein SmJEL517_g03649 [Synchytrium microbalum]|uniref:non-specific serine/threonine protein kinase n=1 Tax=Synchytrium microbalum TaxID=1806994 RepID=A0A507C2B5_9FUNG|nr:uncharacterized protein SmJEL517_g03649 [Synchytrium microbalum]TPX33498.1 hypothetical protein SmJEL517_g03649 [Synchytrium microbalum]
MDMKKRKRSTSTPPAGPREHLKQPDLSRTASNSELRPSNTSSNVQQEAGPRDSPTPNTLIPWSVVLHNEHEGRIVLYKPHMLAVRSIRPPVSTAPTTTNNNTQPRCPFCGNPHCNINPADEYAASLNNPQPGTNVEAQTRNSRSPFVHTDRSYFRLLASIHPSIFEGRDTDTSIRTSIEVETDSICGDDQQPDLASAADEDIVQPQQESYPISPISTAAAPGVSSHSFIDGYYTRFFVEERRLGRGYRGSVFGCQHVLDGVTLGEYAIKKIPVGDSHNWLVRMLKEVNLLEKLKHPNIINYKHAWLENHRLTVFAPEVPYLFILMERANGGNLEEFVSVQYVSDDYDDLSNTSVKKQPSIASVAKERLRRLRQERSTTKPSLTEADERARLYGGIGMSQDGLRKVRYLKDIQIWSLFLDIVEGLAHLHKNSIIHRDLKPPNLLLQYANVNDKSEIPRVLISDFGECEVLSEIHQQARTGATGTVEFLPPELLFQDLGQKFPFEASQTADLWSLGIVLYYLCYSCVPYSQVDDVDLLKEEILRFETPIFPSVDPRVPTELKSLMLELLSRNPAARPSAQSILDRFSSVRVALAEGLAPSGTRKTSMSGDQSFVIPTATGGRVFLAPAPLARQKTHHHNAAAAAIIDRPLSVSSPTSPISTSSQSPPTLNGQSSRIELLDDASPSLPYVPVKSSYNDKTAAMTRRASLVVLPSPPSSASATHHNSGHTPSRISLPFLKQASFRPLDIKVVLFVVKVLSVVYARSRLVLGCAVIVASLDLLSSDVGVGGAAGMKTFSSTLVFAHAVMAALSYRWVIGMVVGVLFVGLGSIMRRFGL